MYSPYIQPYQLYSLVLLRVLLPVRTSFSNFLTRVLLFIIRPQVAAMEGLKVRIGIYYASTSGNTEVVSDYLLETFGSDLAKKYDIEEVGFEEVDQADIVIFGAPTWDYGNLQSDWEDNWQEFESLDLQGKTVALFGVGDQYGYPEWYLDAMGVIYNSLVSKGISPIGQWKVDGYEFESSRALTSDGKHFVGLAIDEESQSMLTKPRVQQWCCDVLEEYAATA